MCETLKDEIHKVEEALQSEYQKVEEAFVKLETESAREYQKVEEAFGKLETESVLRSEQAAADEIHVNRWLELECDKIEEARAELNAIESVHEFLSS